MTKAKKLLISCLEMSQGFLPFSISFTMLIFVWRRLEGTVKIHGRANPSKEIDIARVIVWSLILFHVELVLCLDVYCAYCMNTLTVPYWFGLVCSSRPSPRVVIFIQGQFLEKYG